MVDRTVSCINIIVIYISWLCAYCHNVKHCTHDGLGLRIRHIMIKHISVETWDNMYMVMKVKREKENKLDEDEVDEEEL